MSRMKTTHKKISKGSRVYILKEWQDDGDNNFEWYALDDESNGRINIYAKISGFTFNPIQTIESRMLSLSPQ